VFLVLVHSSLPACTCAGMLMVVEASSARVLASVTTAKRATSGSGFASGGGSGGADSDSGVFALMQPDALVQAIRAQLGETNRTSALALSLSLSHSLISPYSLIYEPPSPPLATPCLALAQPLPRSPRCFGRSWWPRSASRRSTA
jgi:hypothetical protein